MKKIIALVISLAITAGSAFALEQQVAYRILNSYLYDKQARDSDRSGGYWALGTGALLAGSGGALYLWGDPWFEEEDSSAKMWISIGLAAGGIGAMTGGIIELTRAPADFFDEYKYVYEESDAEMQEALAASALYSLAEESKNQRIIGAITNLSIPLIVSGITIGSNIANGEEWNKDVFTISSATTYQLIGGITSLFKKTEEEILYEEYQLSSRILYNID